MVADVAEERDRRRIPVVAPVTAAAGADAAAASIVAPEPAQTGIQAARL